MPKLYNFQGSGNCYKVRLMAALLGVDYEKIDFDRAAGEHKKPDYLAINPLGQVPAWVEDDGTTVCDSQAILVYLAKKCDAGGTWMPDDAAAAAEVVRWLSFTAFEILNGLAFTRAIKIMGRPGDFEAHREIGLKALTALDGQLAERAFLAGATPTVADIAAYPYASLAGDAGFALDDYPNVAAWLGRVEALPGYEALNPQG